MSDCAQCHSPLEPGKKFCTRCGAPAAVPDPVCTQCGAVIAAGKRFCTQCGAGQGQQPQPAAPPRSIPLPLAGNRLVAGVLIAAVVAAIGVGLWWMRRARPAGQSGSFPQSSAAALDIQPLPEMRLTAPAGALGKDRTFQVSRVADADAAQLLPELAKAGIKPFAAYRIDAGMGPEEQFPGYLTVRVGLDKAGIPRQAWSNLAVVHAREDAPPERLVASINGAEATVRLRHNFWMFFLPAAAAVAVYLHRAEAPTGLLETWMQDTSAHFTYNWQPQDSFDVKLNGQFETLSPADRRQKVWPKEMQLFATAFENAYTYLTDERGFEAPNFVIDVYLRNPWPNGDAVALTISPNTFHPYIDVKPRPDPGEVQITALHELFHVFQKQYHVSRNKYLWFDEATALVMENDAESYFLGNHFATAWPVTPSSFGVYYTRGLGDPPDDEGGSRDHGYSASKFFLYLRDRHRSSKTGKDNFLRDLYQGSNIGELASLLKITKDSATLTQDFQDFVNLNRRNGIFNPPNNSAAANPFPAPDVMALSSQSPVMEWERAPFQALSAIWRPYRILQFSGPRMAGTKIVVQEVNPTSNMLVYWTSDLGTNMHQINSSDFELPLPPSANGTFALQRIEPYDQPSDLSDSALTRVFLMMPPDRAPACTLDSERNLTVAWIPSAIANAKLVKEYRILIQPPGGLPALPIVTHDPFTLISMSEIRDFVSKQQGQSGIATLRAQVEAVAKELVLQTSSQDLRDLWEIYVFSEYLQGRRAADRQGPWKVSYQEVAVTGTVGPSSPEASIDLFSSNLDPGTFDPSGYWTGRVVFTNYKSFMDIHMDGSGNLTGTSGAAERVDPTWNRPAHIVGNWDPNSQIWTLQGVATSDKDIDPNKLPPMVRKLVQAPMRRFSNGRLWVIFPPAIFYRSGAAPSTPNTPVR